MGLLIGRAALHRIRRVAPVLGIAAAVCGPAVGLETDQYYAWGRELADATEVLNAKVNLEIASALERVNARRSWERRSCPAVARRIASRFRWFIFHDLELWAANTALVERVPGDEEDELRFMREYLYHRTGLFDPGTKVPPSPTIEVGAVRFGTDKLAHFFSQGWKYYDSYRRGRRSGLGREAAERRAIRRGIRPERTVLGYTWGIFSLADLEANHAGMRFFIDLCEGQAPVLQKDSSGWRQARRFDFREHVAPEWDESFQVSIFGRRRWERVRGVLLGHCPMLHDPTVARQRADYRSRDRETVTEEEIGRLVRAGSLPDPRRFSLESNCPVEDGDGPAGASRPEN